MSDKSNQEKHQPKEAKQAKPRCGIIMPIADNPDLGYPPGHWAQVLEIIKTAAESAGFDADMVSNDTQVDIIHSTIIKNIYNNDVAVCDVSTRNPNVMFELGLRIASKKPVILIKDDITSYSFDTQLIPHLAYRRDLRMFETIGFQKELREKILIAHKEAQQPGYKSFLGQFTSYTLAQIDEKEVGVPEYFAQVANRMQNLEDTIKSLSSAISGQISPYMMTPNNVVPSSLERNSAARLLQTIKWPPSSKIKSRDDYVGDFLTERGLAGTSELSKSQRTELINELTSSRFIGLEKINREKASEIIDN